MAQLVQHAHLIITARVAQQRASHVRHWRAVSIQTVPVVQPRPKIAIPTA